MKKPQGPVGYLQAYLHMHKKKEKGQIEYLKKSRLKCSQI